MKTLNNTGMPMAATFHGYERRPRRRVWISIAIILAAAAFVSARPSSSAAEAPQVRLLSMLRGSPPNLSQWEDRTFLRLPDGSMIVIADSAHFTFKSKYYSEVDKRVILRLIRVLPDGRIDREFAKSRLGRGLRIGTGKEFWKFLQPVQLNETQAMVIGRVGWGWDRMRTIRLVFDLETGELDPTFGTGGAEVVRRNSPGLDFFSWPRASVALSNRRLADCGGLTTGRVDEPAYVRFISSAPWASTRVLLQPSSALRVRTCGAVAETNDRTLLAAGTDASGAGWAPTIWIARIIGNGQLDPTFGIGGMTNLVPPTNRTPSETKAAVTDILPTPDGGAIVIGWIRGEFKDGFFIAKITSSGAMDTAFANNGWMEIRRMHVYSALVAPNGMILLGGGWRKGPSRALRPAVGRLLPNGTWDASFGSKGIAKGVWYDESLRAPLTQMVFSGSDVLAGTVVRKKDWGRLVPARLVRISGLY